jgi:DivIVA domain-containing protein
MRLTPAEVHNVAFKKPSIGKRGYDEDEVDAFLDLVEDELARLIEENNELTARIAAHDTGETPPPPAVVTPPAEAPVVIQPEPAAKPAAAPVSGTDSHVHAARLLGLAQETADRLTAEAAAEAESTLSSARAESERLLAEATSESERLRTEAAAESERLRTEAKTFSDDVVNEAQAKAEADENEARFKAEALLSEARRRSDETLGNLGTQRTELEKKIDDLRVYEREYRSRLKSWITEQLLQLDGSGEAVVSE